MPSGISAIIAKRLRLNLVTRRVVVATILTVLFAAVTFRVAIREYRHDRKLYEAERLAYQLELDGTGLRTYAQTRIVVGKEPRPLGMISGGVERRVGSTVILRGRYGAPQVEQRAGENFLRTVESFDFAQLIGILLSLTALLVTFDVVVGERTRGTMALVRSHAVRWRQILAGEYLAALLTLLPATVLALAIAGLTLGAAEGVELSEGDWWGLVAQGGLLFLLGGASSSLGILCSVLARTEGGALVGAFALWVLLVAVYPDVTSWSGRASESLSVEPAPEVLFSQSSLLVELEPRAESERSAPAFDNDPLAPPAKSWRLQEWSWSLAPFTAYDLGSSILAGTDFEAYARFLDAVRDLDHRLELWQQEKVAQNPSREHRWTWGAGLLDLRDLPPPEVPPVSVPSRLRRTVVPTMALLLWNIVPLCAALILAGAREQG